MRVASALLVLAALVPESHASCDVGAQVYHQAGDRFGRVLERSPGQKVLVEFADDGHIAQVSPTALTDDRGTPCARAALCFYGRVGNLQGKFDDGGSTAQVLAISVPTIVSHVVHANSELAWDIFAHSWDVGLSDAIREALRPLAMETRPQPDIDNVHSFAESTRRSVALKARAEAAGAFRYDLVVLMRYDVFFVSHLRLTEAVPMDRLWTGHWCSIHAEDYSLREILLNSTLDVKDFRSRTSGVFAPSQFVLVGLHDYWFAASSEDMDRFVGWGSAIDGLRARFGLRSPELPEHFGHFYTFLYSKMIGLKFGYLTRSYLDYRLVRHRNCMLQLGRRVKNEHLFCQDWNILTTVCEDWRMIPHGGALVFCPVAGRQATLAPGSRGCGKF